MKTLIETLTRALARILATILVLGTPGGALAATVIVPGTANPWLAGITTNGFQEAWGDVTPDESPVLFTNFNAGASLLFAASGSAGYEAGAESGPLGIAGYFVSHPAEDGIGEIDGSLANALIGVFLDNSQPDFSSPPTNVFDFTTDDSRNYLVLRPVLRQPFYIGSGTNAGGVPQIVIPPAGATRLFLGIQDGFGWYNNTGSFTVNVGPPSPLPAIDSFSVLPGPAPIRTSNPWTFSAVYSTLVSDLRLRVQTTLTPTNEASWTYLPGDMTHVDANWTLNRTVVPTGDCYFRVIASAPGYVDANSAAVGPFTVLDGSVVLADNGFRSNVNGFGFENYGNPPGRTNLTPVEVQRLFGDVVFAMTNGPDRILTPSGQKWMEATSAGMADGHCEGMAVLSRLVYSGLLDPAQFGNASINALAIDGNPVLQREIAFWWATQSVDPTRSSAIVDTPTNILNVLIASLKREVQETYVLHVFMEGKGGHAVTPYAVADLGNGFTEVRLYDNNHPNIERTLLIDRIENTWEFNLSTNPNEAESLWSGDATTDTIAVAPSSPRLQTQVCPFCLNTSGTASVVNEIWVGGDGVKILLMDAQGNRYGYQAGTFYQEIPGVTHRTLTSGDELWQASPSPNYYVPVGTAVTTTLDGSAITNTTQSSVTMIGPGYHLSIEDIQLDPNQKDTIVFSPDGNSLSYQPASSESPTIRLGFETPSNDYDFTLKGLNIENNATLKLQLDKVKNTLSIQTPGNTVASTYALVMGRLDKNFAQYFDHGAIQLGPNDTAILDYGNWVGDGATLPLLIDQGSDGTVDQTVQLTDEDTVTGPAPRLSVQPAGGGTVKVSWPSSAATFILETNSTLSATGWAAVPTNQFNTVGVNTVFMDSDSGTARFYRLRRNQ